MQATLLDRRSFLRVSAVAEEASSSPSISIPSPKSLPSRRSSRPPPSCPPRSSASLLTALSPSWARILKSARA